MIPTPKSAKISNIPLALKKEASEGKTLEIWKGSIIGSRKGSI